MDDAWFREVNARRNQLRKEEGKPDENPQTAEGKDLDAIGATLDLYRTPAETYADYAFRKRILDCLEKRARKL